MTKKEKIYAAASAYKGQRPFLYDLVRKHPDFVSRGGVIYPYDSIDANLDPLFSFLEEAGFNAILESQEVQSLIDVGCANGDLSLVFARAGLDVAAIDFTFKHDQAPLVVSIIAQELGLRIPVVDISIDGNFVAKDLSAAIINQSNAGGSLPERFDLAICLGLLYHLKNPFAFLESMSKITKYMVLGTHVMSFLPDLRVKVADEHIAYLVDAGELNDDPTNYWIFTHKSLALIAKRAGFEILGLKRIFNNPAELSVPNRVDLGERAFVLLKAP